MSDTKNISGHDLIEHGIKPGPGFTDLINHAKHLIENGASVSGALDTVKDIRQVAIEAELASRPPLISKNVEIRRYADFLYDVVDVDDPYQVDNYISSIRHMDDIMKLPTVVDGALMPDACPSGSALGTIPVGGVVSTRNTIHPDMHSADICCSMAITIFGNDHDPKLILDNAMEITHFGPGKRTKSQVRQNKDLTNFIKQFAGNSFLAGLEGKAEEHFMTQGDGNHFLYVGRLESTGHLAMVTHHGSRGLGAQLYKRGMIAAKKHMIEINADVPGHQSWLTADTPEGQEYWEALQIVRRWTKMNHFGIHDAILHSVDDVAAHQWWNEHNFVFKRGDGMIYHGKGATPSFHGFSADDVGTTLIPMNMSAPILVCKHTNRPEALGFAPHGAGRNMSRTAYLNNFEEKMPEGIDARFYSGESDMSELPGAYKDAEVVEGSIRKHNLAEIVDRILPYGSIMGGVFKWNKHKKK